MATETKVFVVGAVSILLVIALVGAVYTVKAGERGVVLRWGRALDSSVDAGIHARIPIADRVVKMPIRQQSVENATACFSSDLQTVTITSTMLVRFPPDKVVQLYRDYQKDVLGQMVIPRFEESLKQVTARLSAQELVRQREKIKEDTLGDLRKRLSDLIAVDDIALRNIDLSDQLEAAIEAKMVQEQEAAKALFVQTRTRTEAETAIIRAEGEAKAISIRAAALAQNPAIIDLTIAEKWDGHTPLVVGAGNGAGVLLPLKTTARE